MSDEKVQAKPAKSTVYVDVEDDIAAIIDKVEAAKQAVVALVLPKRSTVMQSTVNMRLLKRSAGTADKKIVLVTSEAALLPLAGAAGLPVAKNLQAVPEVPSVPVTAPTVTPKANHKAKIDYDEPPSALASNKLDSEEPETIDLEEKAEKPTADEPTKQPKSPHGKLAKIPNFDRFRNRLSLIIAGFVLLIILFVIAAKVLPKATVTLQTTSSPVSTSLSLTTSDKLKALDLKAGQIPAQLKTTDQTANQQVTATGKKNLGNKAAGTVSMSGGSCGPSVPADVPAGSAATANGLTYITQSNTSFTTDLSGGSCKFVATHTTPITAQNGGANYNVSSGTSFSVPGRSDVSASGSASGGTDNNVTILSQTDVDNAVKQLTSASSSKNLTDQFKQQLDNQGFYVISSTLKSGTPQVTATPAVGQQTSSSSLSIKVTYTVLVVSKDDLTKAITDSFNKQIDTAHQKISSTNVLKDAEVTVSSQGSPTVASLSITDKSTAVPVLDSNAIKKQIGGHKAGDIRSSLGSLPGVKNVDVHLSPFWVTTAPKNVGKIRVVLQEVPDSSPSPTPSSSTTTP